MIEILGISASLMVLISFLFRKEAHIRAVNIAGALLFVIYGYCIDSFSVWFLNGVLIIIHLYYLGLAMDK